MATLVFEKGFLDDFAKLEPTVRQKVRDLPDKFSEAVHTGVHLEKLKTAVDDRVRTVRVDQFWRGVVVNLGNGRYALLRVLPHDDAIDWAARQKFGVNPVTGIVELIDVPTVAEYVDKMTLVTDATAPGLFDAIGDKDFQQLGITEELIPLLRRLRDEAELYAIATYLPKAQGDAVLLLADGKNPEEVWAILAEDYAISTEKVDPEDLDTALERPGSRAEFVVTSNDQELLKLLSGDFEVWRTFLHPTQRGLAERPEFNGPVKVTGGAGTGKTVVAIHRARFLARRLLDAGDTTGRILVGTYTTSLARNLERTLKSFCTPEEFARLHISTIDSLAYQTLLANDVRLRPVESNALRDRADSAAAMAALDEYGLDGRFLLLEWSQVIIGRDLGSLPEYATAPRPGRGKALARPARQAVWQAAVYLTDDLHRNGLATYEQLAARAAETLVARSAPPYRHVIVDEAQDLHPAQWRLLRAAVAPGPNDLFIAGDAHQRIYDSRVSLASMGIETRGRSRRLKVNYRTSQQILAWALGILTGEPIDDLDGNLEPQVGYRSEFQGPPPLVQHFDTTVEEAQFVVDVVKRWVEAGVAPGSIGIVARTNDDTIAIRSACDASGLKWSELGANRQGLVIGTMHSSKGLEFARLAVVGVNADRIPLPFAVMSEAEDAKQHQLDLQRERCLLYVACTRARDALCVTSSGVPSVFLPGPVEG